MSHALSRRMGKGIAVGIVIVVAAIAWIRFGRQSSAPLAPEPPLTQAPVSRTRVALVDGCVALAGDPSNPRHCLAADELVASGARLTSEGAAAASLELESGGELAIFGDSEVVVKAGEIALERGTIRVRSLPAASHVALGEG